MDLIFKKNTALNDEELIQQVVRRGLVALSLVIILLSAAAVWTVVQLTDFYQNKVNLITKQENLLHVMRIAGRERTLLMYAMVNEEDPFLNDDNRMAFYSEGAKFAQARIEFVKSPLANNERYLVENQGTLTKANRPIHEEIVDLVIKGEDKSALKLLRERAIPEQNKVIQVLDQLHLSIEKRSNKIKAKADSISLASIIILILIVIIIILGAIYITRQTTYRSFNLISKLNETRAMLQNTIHELIQQKDTLDHHAIVSIADRQGAITYVNDKFCEVSGYSQDELIGKNHNLLKSDKHTSKFYQKLWTTISKGNIWQGKICNKRKDGSYYWVESTISPFLDDKGIPYQYVSIRTDITSLLEAKNEAVEANNTKSLFLASMSHELRTPMNAIIGFSQILHMKAKDEVSKQNLKEIMDAGNHLLSLINDILDLSKIESDKIEVQINSHSLKEIILFSLSMVISSAEEMSIQINNKINSLSDINIDVDKQRMNQVLLNLLSNAIKYNKENGTVTIDYSIKDNEMVEISVADTGRGLSLEQQAHLFRPFDRAGIEGSNISGSGLGLVISKKLIEKMNGTIGFESNVGKGSRFWIKVPLS